MFSAIDMEEHVGRPIGRRGESRARVLEAAVKLFSENGVSGTSLRMIADELGVTKAAVYHQFASKEEIVLAVAQPAVDGLTSAADHAEQQSPPHARFDAALEGLVAVVIQQRASAVVIRDPVAARLLETHSQYRIALNRIQDFLIGSEPTEEARIALALLGGSLFVSGTDPALIAVGADRLRATLQETARNLLQPFRPPA
jgi:AcrR family transcriptional regulator